MSMFFASESSPSQHALRAIEAASGGKVRAHYSPDFLANVNPAPERTVALVGVGGAHTAPLHLGGVGTGGLDAAVPAEPGANPQRTQILAAARTVARDSGVLCLGLPETTSVLDTALANELLTEGIFVRELVLPAATTAVVVEKILGAAADRGLGLQQLRGYGSAVVERTGQRSAHDSTRPLEVVIDEMVGEILESLPTPEAGVLATVNNDADLSALELAHVAIETERSLRDADVPIRSIVFGSFAGAATKAGFSIALTAVEDPWMYDWLTPHTTLSLPSPGVWRTPPRPEH